MRKLPFLFLFLFWSIGNITANETDPINKTYSVEAQTFSTNFGNSFANYHVNLDLKDLTRVARNGTLRIVVEFIKGMEVKESRFEKKPNGATYYVTDFTSPTYKVSVFDKSENILLEKNYGGKDLQKDFGKEKNYPEDTLAAKWLNEKDGYFQKLEFQSLKFKDLEKDLVQVMDNLSTTAFLKGKVSKGSPLAEPKQISSPRTNMEKNGGVVDETAAAQESEMLKEPFSELNDQITTKDIPTPDAPRDFSEPVESTEEVAMKPTKTMEKKKGVAPSVMAARKNIIKLNLPNLALGNITLNYERVLSPRTSMAINLGYIRPQSPSSFYADDEWTDEEFSGLTVTGEYRIYGKKKGAPKGFYYAPYLRYASYNLDYKGDIDGNLTDVAAKMSTFGIGAQIGVQWLIKNRVSIDWGILGLSAQRYSLSATFTSTDEAVDFDEIRVELEKEIDDSTISNKVEFTSGDDFLKAKMPFIFGGARAYLSVGYSF